MKKLVLIYGLIAGLISTIGFVLMSSGKELNMEYGMFYGFGSMLLAFSLIFVASAQFKKQNGGTISFARSFLTGLYISLIASTVYVLVWLIILYNVHPDFTDKYAACVIDQMKADGESQAAIAKATVKMEEFKIQYKNPLYVILITYAEVLPIGLLMTLINSGVFALIGFLKRKSVSV